MMIIIAVAVVIAAAIVMTLDQSIAAGLLLTL